MNNFYPLVDLALPFSMMTDSENDWEQTEKVSDAEEASPPSKSHSLFNLFATVVYLVVVYLVVIYLVVVYTAFCLLYVPKAILLFSFIVGLLLWLLLHAIVDEAPTSSSLDSKEGTVQYTIAEINLDGQSDPSAFNDQFVDDHSPDGEQELDDGTSFTFDPCVGIGGDSTDAIWEAINARLRSSTAVEKSWERQQHRHLERAAVTAKEMRRSPAVSPRASPRKEKPLPTKKEVDQPAEAGWRSRAALDVKKEREELFAKSEKFIKNHYDGLRLQRQESMRRRHLKSLLCRGDIRGEDVWTSNGLNGGGHRLRPHGIASYPVPAAASS